MEINKMSLPELKFWYRAFIAYLADLQRNFKAGRKTVEGDIPIEIEIKKAERLMSDLNFLIKRKILTNENVQIQSRRVPQKPDQTTNVSY